MSGKARPRMPSVGSSTNSADSCVTAEKIWFFTTTPAILTVEQTDQHRIATLMESVEWRSGIGNSYVTYQCQ